MTQNPFETPLTTEPLEPGAGGAQVGTGRFDIGRALSEAWRMTWANFPLWLGVGIVAGLVSVLAAFTIIGLFIVVPVLAWGGTRFLLNMHDGRAEFGDVFSGFKEGFGQVLGSMLLLMVLFWILGLAGQSVSLIGQAADSPVLSALGSVFYLAFTVLVLVRFYFAAFFLVDQRMGAVDAMKASWEATRDQKGAVVLLALLSFAVAMAGVLALVVGVIFALPITYLMWTSAYRQMVGGPSQP